MLTVSEKEEIDKALQDAGGRRAEAAKALGMTWQQLRDAIKNCPDLKVRWSRTRRAFAAPTAEEIANRPAIPADQFVPREPLPNQAQVEKYMALADAKLHGGLQRSPLTSEERSLTEELHALQTRHGLQISETIHGCSSVIAIKMTNKVAKMLQRSEALDEVEQTEQVQSEKKFLLELAPVYAAEVRKMVEMDRKHAIAKANLEFRKSQNAMPKSRQKPGFAPLVAVSVAPGSKVELDDSKRKETG